MTAIVYLFSYGTLQYPEVQKASFGRLLEGSDDVMPGFRKDMVEIGDPDVVAKSGERFHPIVMPSTDPKDEVAGKVFTITTDESDLVDGSVVDSVRRIGGTGVRGIIELFQLRLRCIERSVNMTRAPAMSHVRLIDQVSCFLEPMDNRP
ncbi:MAG TPA: gamma-glutamylcyclotransferase family protein [Rhizobium sp.]